MNGVRPHFLDLLAGVIALVAAGTVLATPACAQSKYPGVGRAATPAEIAAWDIDVRPDFKGLPKGSGSVAKGELVWEAKCASCHGTFGESNEWFQPIVGGTTKEDIKTGRVKTLVTGDVSRTTLMKLSSISTLWDYINRAMPWTAPKSLTTEEVYAVVAYILHLGDIVPADFTLSDANIADVQQKLPNRNGMSRAHGLWDVKGTPDVKNVACMKDCPTGNGAVTSSLPEHARDAHGNLAEQNRVIGGVRGADTTHPAPASAEAPKASTAAAPKKVAAATPSPADLAKAKACTACHNVDKKVVGPSWSDIAAKYRAVAGSDAKLAAKVKSGGSGVWGAVPMPPNPDLPDADALALARWILSGGK